MEDQAKDLKDIAKRIYNRAIENNDFAKCSSDKAEFEKGMMFFMERINEIQYSKFTGSYILPSNGKRKAVAISTENA